MTDEALEQILNEWTARGWRLESIQFVVREASRRPGMAFVLFTREKGDFQPVNPPIPAGPGS